MDLQAKNDTNLSFPSKGTDITWDEADFSWEDAGGTWDVVGTDLTAQTPAATSLSGGTKPTPQ